MPAISDGPGSTQEDTLLASAARTATNTTRDVSNHYGRGVRVFIDFTATPNNTETLTLAILGKDPASGKYQALTAFAALTSSAIGAAPTTETYVYELYPAVVETAATGHHEVQGGSLPRTWAVRLTHSASTAWTYTVGYSTIP